MFCSQIKVTHGLMRRFSNKHKLNQLTRSDPNYVSKFLKETRKLKAFLNFFFIRLVGLFYQEGFKGK